MTLEKKKLISALGNAIVKVDNLIKIMGNSYPSPASINNRYEKIANDYWTTSFFPGMIMLSYEFTKDDKYKTEAYKHVLKFKKRLEDRVGLDTHDIGFLYDLSCMKYYNIFGDNLAKDTAIDAAMLLSARYHEKAGIIQAWGGLEDTALRGRMIIDCNMNLPLLVFASKQDKDKKHLYDIVYSHVKNAQKYIVRDDNSTYHTYHFDPEKGNALYGTTQQGYSNDSCWARGQAWAVYGFSLAYEYSKDASLLDTAKDCADYFLSHLPSDKVCCWDLIFMDGEQERDSSAAAICACGLYELAKYLGKTKGEKYYNAAVAITESLIDNYSVTDDSADGLILHSVYAKPDNKGVDECSTWGDYYYLELLMKFYNEINEDLMQKNQ